MWIYKGQALGTRAEREAAAAAVRLGQRGTAAPARPRRPREDAEGAVEASTVSAAEAPVLVEALVEATTVTEGQEA